jgi:hypothetical protein
MKKASTLRLGSFFRSAVSATKALLLLSAVAMPVTVLAQGTTGGTLLFRTLQIQNAAGTANYNVPLSNATVTLYPTMAPSAPAFSRVV